MSDILCPTFGSGVGGFDANINRGWYTRGLRGYSSTNSIRTIDVITTLIISATVKDSVELVAVERSQSTRTHKFGVEVELRGEHKVLPDEKATSTSPSWPVHSAAFHGYQFLAVETTATLSAGYELQCYGWGGVLQALGKQKEERQRVGGKRMPLTRCWVAVHSGATALRSSIAVDAV